MPSVVFSWPVGASVAGRRVRRGDRIRRSGKRSGNLLGVTKEVFLCPGCSAPKPRRDFHEQPGEGRNAVTWLCKLCRSETYFKAHYPDPCTSCSRHRRLSQNTLECSDCLDERGLRECRTCLALLPLALSFSDLGSFRCRTCD